MINPFTEIPTTDLTDKKLVEQALKGQRPALEMLIKRHQAWIYNIAFRMVWHPQDAEDITQEILIKILTKLSTFKGQASFRTWLYRIVTNHVLNIKKCRAENRFISFEQYGGAIDRTPDFDPPDPNSLPVDLPIILEETQIHCMLGMLLCLDRQQRLAFILGEIIGVDHSVGSEILEINKDHFRQNLSRARKKLYNFMNAKCGLIHPGNPCHCTRKLKALINCGAVNPRRLLFNTNYLYRMKAVSVQKIEQLNDFLYSKCRTLFREHPFQNSPDFVESLKEILADHNLQAVLN